MTTVRTDVFKLGDKFATLLGDEVRVGDVAPEFTSVVSGWSTVNPLQESKGKVIILSAVPSLDTETCDRETRRFNGSREVERRYCDYTTVRTFLWHRSAGARQRVSIK
jgi:peroxiredoxin